MVWDLPFQPVDLIILRLSSLSQFSGNARVPQHIETTCVVSDEVANFLTFLVKRVAETINSDSF